MKRKRLLRRGLWTLLFLFLALNILTAFHAYKFTHYDATLTDKPVAERMSAGQKVKAALLGVALPRARNTVFPARPYDAVVLQEPGRIHCWWVPVEGAAGTVLLFPGYGGSKSNMVDRGEAFSRLGYNTLLVDFTGTGDSEGSSTTIGYREGTEVRACMAWVAQRSSGPVHLFGTSLGAAAILKAVADGAEPASILIECPFGSLLQAVKNRCRAVGAPVFPVAQLLTFWGGVEHGFNAFRHNPQEYAKSVRCPALLMWGERDDRVLRSETDAVYAGLAGPKTLVTFPGVGHQNYLKADSVRWCGTVEAFLE